MRDWLFVTLLFVCTIQIGNGIEVLKKGFGKDDSVPSSMPTDHQGYVEEQYKLFMKQRQEEKKRKEQANKPPPPPEGISPKALGMKRDDDSVVQITKQVNKVRLW